MASFKRRGDKHIAEVRIKGRYSSKTFDTKQQAKEWARLEEHKLTQSKGILKGKSLSEAFHRYAAEEAPHKKGYRWEEIRLKKLDRDPIASLQLCDLTQQDFSDWITRQERDGLKGSSINRELHVISAVLSCARKQWKWIEGNPLENVKRPKESPPRNKLITEDEIKKILQALQYKEGKPVVTTRQKIAVAFLFAIETGMRQGEIWNMQWEHANLGKRFVHLPDTKNGEERNVDLSTKAVKLLESLGPKESGPVIDVSQGVAQVIFPRAVQLAGYKGIITFHDTRHLATTRLAKKLDMLDLAKMIGHKDPRNLMIYFNPAPGSLADRLG